MILQTCRSFIWLCLFCSIGFVVSATSCRAQDGKSKKKLNVLFLLTDDQRADTIAALGNEHIKTPNLDKLVKDGFVFNKAYCMGSMAGAVCMPSRCMILTGRTLFRATNKANAPILPLLLKMAGYVTYRTGKRGNNPPWANKEFHTNINVPRNPKGSMVHADNAIGFLKKQKGSKQPFFLYVAFGAPHDPRVVPKEYMDMYDVGDVPLPKNYLPVHPFDNGDMTIRDERLAAWPRTKTEIQRHLADYYSDITYLDAQIGRILATLTEIGELENTLIIFSSDHGLAVGSHGLMGKQSIYDHSMRVPMIVAGPGIPAGKSSDAFVYLLDVLPTICDYCRVDVPNTVEGKSLWPIMQGKQEKVRDSLFLGYKTQRAVYDGRWKLIRYTHINRSQLFDMQSDPDEIHDLSTDPKQAKKIEELMGLLKTWQTKLGDKMKLTSAKPKDSKFTPPANKKKKGKKKKGKKSASLGMQRWPIIRVPSSGNGSPEYCVNRRTHQPATRVTRNEERC